MRPSPFIPDPRAVEAADPSEAVRSADMLRVVGERVEIVDQHQPAGPPAPVLLRASWATSTPTTRARWLCWRLSFLEVALIAAGDVGSDFVLVWGEPGGRHMTRASLRAAPRGSL